MNTEAVRGLTLLPFFAGLTPSECQALLIRAATTSVVAGQHVLRVGEIPAKLYVILSGTAQVVLESANSVERPLRTVSVGETLGEMSLFANEPASASVRALTDLELLAIDRSDFPDLALAYPQLHRNIGAMLAQRLTHATRSLLQDEEATLTTLTDEGAPRGVCDALAASLAWHTQAAVLLIDTTGPPIDHATDLPKPLGARAVRYACPASGDSDGLRTALHQLRHRFAHILVKVVPSFRSDLGARRRLVIGPAAVQVNDASADYRIAAWGEPSLAPGERDGVVEVVRPTGAESVAITAGYLPGSGPAGKTFGWVARDIAGLKVGLALGAGGTRGFAHIGALSVLLRRGLPIDYLAGSSAGALVAAMFVAGDEPEVIRTKLRNVGKATFRPTVPRHSILSNRGIRDLMRNDWGERRIEESRIPLGIVAVDLETLRQVVFRTGLLWVATLASSAIPGVYPPVRVGERCLIDGGVLNPLPVDVCQSMGADHIVGIRLADVRPTAPIEAAATSAGAPTFSILQVLLRSMDAVQGAVNTAPTSRGCTIIEPTFPPSSRFTMKDFSLGDQYVESGEDATERAIAELVAVFPWMSETRR